MLNFSFFTGKTPVDKIGSKFSEDHIRTVLRGEEVAQRISPIFILLYGFDTAPGTVNETARLLPCSEFKTLRS